MNNELKPFDVQKEFADNGFTFFTKNLILCSGNTTENNAMTIGWGGIGNYLGHDRPAVTVYVAPARYTQRPHGLQPTRLLNKDPSK